MRRAWRQKTNPCLILMKVTVWTLEYLDFRCWKHDTDRLYSFWNIASQNQKSGCVFSTWRVYSAKYGRNTNFDQNDIFSLISTHWCMNCCRGNRCLIYWTGIYVSRPRSLSLPYSLLLGLHNPLGYVRQEGEQQRQKLSLKCFRLDFEAAIPQTVPQLRIEA